MNYKSLLLAEQSIFAKLVIIKKAVKLTKFQTATLSDGPYEYARDEIPYTNVDPDQYCISNLPDTIAFVPKNSVFDNIILIPKSSPDYRFVKIAPSEWLEEPTKVAIVADKNISVKRFKADKKTKNLVLSHYPLKKTIDESSDDDEYFDAPRDDRQRTIVTPTAPLEQSAIPSVFTSEQSATSAVSPSQQSLSSAPLTETLTPKTSNSALDSDSGNESDGFGDEKKPGIGGRMIANIANTVGFTNKYASEDIRLASIDMSNFESDAEFADEVVPKITTLLTQNEEKLENEPTWYQALINSFGFSSLISKSAAKNEKTVTYRIILFLMRKLRQHKNVAYTAEKISAIKDVLQDYVRTYNR